MLDDGAARRCARSLFLAITGTLAVVLLAKQYGSLDFAAQVLHDLRSADFRIDDKTIHDALESTVGKNGNGKVIPLRGEYSKEEQNREVYTMAAISYLARRGPHG